MHVCCTYSRYPHFIVKNPLQFVPVCSSLSQLVPVSSSLSFLHSVSKIDENPWGQIWVTVFWGGAGRFRGSQWVTKAGEWALKVFRLHGKREAADGPRSCCALSPCRRRPFASARAYRASSILATNSLAHRIASSTSWSTGKPSARAAYISSHPFCLAMAGGQACARL